MKSRTLNLVLLLILLGSLLLTGCSFGYYRGDYHISTETTPPYTNEAFDQLTVGFGCDENIDLDYNHQPRGYTLTEGTCHAEGRP